MSLIWSRRLLAFLFLSATVAVGVYAAASQLRQPPRAELRQESLRLVAPAGARRVEARVGIANRGGGVLRLTKLRSTYGCTVQAIDRTSVRSGEEATILVEATPPGAGERAVMIGIETNDPDRPLLEFRLEVVGTRSLPYVADSTGPVQFGDLSTTDGVETVWLLARERRDSPPWLLNPRGDLAGLTIEGGMTEEGPTSGEMITRRYRYEVRLARPSEPGELDGAILFGGDQSEMPIHRLEVRAVARAAVVATPRSFLASLLPDETAPRFIVGLTTIDPEFSLNVEPGPPVTDGLQIHRVSEAAGRWVFEVTFASRPESSIEEVLIFRTNHPDAPTLEVPFSLQVVDVLSPGG